MRTSIILSFLISCFSIAARAQTVQLSDMFGTWQVDEFYADSVRIDSSAVLSLQFTFQPSQFSISDVSSGGTNTVRGNWAANPQQTQLMLASTNDAARTSTSSSVFDLIYLDQNVLALVTRGINNTNGQEVIFELRLRPVN